VKRPVGVIVAAILLLIGSLFQFLMAAVMALSGAFMPIAAVAGGASGAAGGAPMPGFMHGFMFALSAVCLALAVWGIITTVGLFRLRRWARYSVLVIGGIIAAIGGFSMLTSLIILAIPMTPTAGMDASDASTFAAMKYVIFAVSEIMYGIMTGVGVWWLVYFNRKQVREVFHSGAAVEGGTLEIVRSQRPVAITVLAVLELFGAACCMMIAVLPFPGILFGIALQGWQKAMFLLFFAAAQAAMGVGLWRLAEWGRRLGMLLMAFGIAQCVFCMLRPSQIVSISAEFNQRMGLPASPLPAQAQNIMFISMFGFSLLFCFAIVAVLIYYRSAFVKPAELAA
jgi:uncharacterized membrane protein (DUF2068 family)